MKYIENNYYELIEHGKSDVIRFVREENSRYIFKCLTDIRDYVNGVKLGEFGPLQIINVESIKEVENNELIVKHYKSIFNIFLDKYGYKMTVGNNGCFLLIPDSELNLLENIEKNKDYLRKYILERNTINFFFEKLDSLGIILSIEEKDKFLIEQFS